ncbi:MAG: TlpA family protein disulfide reductase [Gammaproteobacteria bacterium]|nr:TlpA family protein disulfide reductase [Gammaproteobacteria bacterium]
MNSKKTLLLALLILICTLSSYASYRYALIQEAVEETLIRPEFAMVDINGQTRSISEWDGQIILLNFWATWCPPCLEEIPGFIELQEQYGNQGFQIIGIAADNEDAVRKFAEETKFNYPIIAAELEALELIGRYGNRSGGIPYSVFINREGEISDRIMGELSKIKAEQLLISLGLKS